MLVHGKHPVRMSYMLQYLLPGVTFSHDYSQGSSYTLMLPAEICRSPVSVYRHPLGEPTDGFVKVRDRHIAECNINSAEWYQPFS